MSKGTKGTKGTQGTQDTQGTQGFWTTILPILRVILSFPADATGHASAYRIGRYPATSIVRRFGMLWTDERPFLCAIAECVYVAQTGTRIPSSLRETIDGNIRNGQSGNLKKGIPPSLVDSDRDAINGLRDAFRTHGIGNIDAFYVACGINQNDAQDVAGMRITM